jgi:hypothetical protein
VHFDVTWSIGTAAPELLINKIQMIAAVSRPGAGGPISDPTEGCRAYLIVCPFIRSGSIKLPNKARRRGHNSRDYSHAYRSLITQSHLHGYIGGKRSLRRVFCRERQQGTVRRGAGVTVEKGRIGSL